MNRKSLEKLGYFEMLEAVARSTAFPPAREAVRTSMPESNAARLNEMVHLVAEAAECLQRGMDLPGAGAIEADELIVILGQAHSMLTGSQLVELRELCVAAAAFRRFQKQARKEAPGLADLCGGVVNLDDLRHRLSETIDEDGRVRDNASDALKKVRRAISSSERERQRSIEQITRKLFNAGRLRENYHTIRDDRIVVPVKSGDHTRVDGIVHDVSQTGETYFIEPAEIVKITNEIFSLYAREEVETAKVLRMLTDEAREFLPDLRANVALLTRLESIFARARFGERNEWHLPEVREDAALDLRDCHHPLLALERPKESQPNSIALDADDRAVVISGPNAGGKTTLLKMLGLVAAMAQTALPLPLALDSRLPCFSGIFAEIGDEQDISTGMSSFSAHVRNLSEILREADEGALVMLDEIGGSTDPEEGAALGVGILATLADRGALTVATSHYTILKEWAHDFAKARNVSFYLDGETHKPTFNLMMDVPGTSEAFVVAREEGLPADVIARAEKHSNPEQRKLNELLVEMQRKDAEMQRLKDELKETAATLERERSEFEALNEELNRERKNFKGEILREKEAEMRQLRADLERVIAHQPSKEELEKTRRALTAIQKDTAKEREKVEKPKSISFLATGRLKPGMTLKVREWDEPAEVLSVDQRKEQARVRIGALEITIPFRDIEGTVKKSKKKKTDAFVRPTPNVTVNRARESAALELDLHGKRVEEALELVDQYLNDAILSHLPHARILHGIGTGALRDAVRELLQTHPLVKSWRAGTADEGGIGATTVYFK